MQAKIVTVLADRPGVNWASLQPAIMHRIGSFGAAPFSFSHRVIISDRPGISVSGQVQGACAAGRPAGKWRWYGAGARTGTGSGLAERRDGTARVPSLLPYIASEGPTAADCWTGATPADINHTASPTGQVRITALCGWCCDFFGHLQMIYHLIITYKRQTSGQWS